MFLLMFNCGPRHRISYRVESLHYQVPGRVAIVPFNFVVVTMNLSPWEEAGLAPGPHLSLFWTLDFSLHAWWPSMGFSTCPSYSCLIVCVFIQANPVLSEHHVTPGSAPHEQLWKVRVSHAVACVPQSSALSCEGILELH